jgi:UDP-N-acetylglucosamine acyltransferase
MAYRDCVSYVSIGARSVIREGVTVHRGTKPGSVTRVGASCLLMANSHLAHDVRLGDRVIVANGALLAGYVQVGDAAFISGNCLVHQFTRVGRLAMMSGGSAVQMDVPPFCITRSSSSNTVIGLNVIGLRRAGFTSPDRAALKSAFALLYRSGLTVPKALQRLEREDTSPLVLELCRFVASARRGICKFVRDSESEPGGTMHRAA